MKVEVQQAIAGFALLVACVACSSDWDDQHDEASDPNAVTLVGKVEETTGVVVSGNYVYFATRPIPSVSFTEGPWSFRRVPKAGGEVEVVTETTEVLGDFAVDGNALCWTIMAPTPGELFKVDVDGKNRATLFTATTHVDDAPTVLALAGGYVYWLNSRRELVSRTPLAGGPTIALIPTPRAHSLSLDDRYIYLAQALDAQTSAITRTPLEGGESVVLVPEAAGRIVPFDGEVYWTDYNSLWKVSRDGGEPRWLASLENPFSLSVDASGIYVMSGPDGIEPANVLWISHDGSEQAWVTRRPGERLLHSLALDDRYIFRIVDGSIVRVPKPSR